MRPLQIYLDSSDFSNFAMPQSLDVIGVEEQLKRWRDEGLIELRFSYLHVIEAAPIRPVDIERAAARFRKIKELCGTKCIVSTISIIEREIAHPGAIAKPGYLEWILGDGEDWLPDSDLDLDSISIKGFLREELQKLPRSERRKRERLLLKPDGRPRTALSAALASELPTVISEIGAKYPLAPGFAEKIAKCLASQTTRHQAPLLLRQSISDIDYWPAWFSRHWDRVQPLTEFLRRNGKVVSEGLAHYLDQNAIIFQRGINSGLSEQQMLKFKRKSFEDMASTLYPNIVQRLGTRMGLEPTETDPESAFKVRPGLATSLRVHCEIARKTMLNDRTQRLPKVSDFGDVLHCTHLPFVDIYRADGFIADILKSAKLPFKTRIAPNLLQLPKIIEALLEN